MAAEQVLADRGLDRSRLVGLLRDYGIYAAIVVLVLVAGLLKVNLLSISNLQVQIAQLVPTLLVSLGMALVIATEGVDLSVGAVIALAASLITLYLGYNATVAILVCLVGGVFAGLVSGAMVAFGRVQPIVATLAMMIGLRGVALIFIGKQAKQPVNDPTLNAIGVGDVFGIPVMAVIAVVVIGVVLFVVRRSIFGGQLVAIGDNRTASQLAGLPVRRVLLLVYAISGLLAAAAGVLLVGYNGDADPANQGLNIELDAITAVVVGGTPLTGGRIRVIGTVAGALFMQLLKATLIQKNVSLPYAQMVEAAIICLAVYVAKSGTRT